MQNMMVLGQTDLKKGKAVAESVTMNAFRKPIVKRKNDYDFILYVSGKDIHVLKSTFGVKGLGSLVKWVDAQSCWLSMAKSF